jgi:catechol 2,3-dioxygenase-like lactoylglutathione lyase family enzyme
MSHNNRFIISIIISVWWCLPGIPGPAAARGAQEASGAPPGIVLRPGHLGRQTGDLEQIIRFYHDLLGMELRGERHTDRPFWSSEPLIEFVDAPPHAEFRAVILPIQGTAAVPNRGDEMTIEAIEYRNIERHQYISRLQDTGISWLRLILRDLDKTLTRLEQAGTLIVTRTGAPVVFDKRPGFTGRTRSIIVRDPDGYAVELVEQTPLPANTAPEDSNIIGAHVVVVVEHIESTLAFYRQLIGPDLQTWSGPTFITDPDFNNLCDTPGARSRSGTMMVPGSPVMMEFVQYDNISYKAIKPRFQDIGIGHMLFMVNDMDTIMSRIRAARLQTLAKSGEPVYLNPQVRAVFIRDPADFFVEFMERRQD